MDSELTLYLAHDLFQILFLDVKGMSVRRELSTDDVRYVGLKGFLYLFAQPRVFLYKFRSELVEHAKDVMCHKSLAITRLTGAVADSWNAETFGYDLRYLVRHALKDDGECPCFFNRERIINYSSGRMNVPTLDSIPS